MRLYCQLADELVTLGMFFKKIVSFLVKILVPRKSCCK